jgi:hypothetical protein
MPTAHPQNVGNRQMPGLIIGKAFARPRFRGLPASFQTATASFSEKRDQAPHLLIFLRSKTRLKLAKPSIDSLHRLLHLFGDCGTGRSTTSVIELVTTFSGEKNWRIISTGWLVGRMVVSNRSKRRDRPLLIIFVLSDL